MNDLRSHKYYYFYVFNQLPRRESSTIENSRNGNRDLMNLARIGPLNVSSISLSIDIHDTRIVTHETELLGQNSPCYWIYRRVNSLYWIYRDIFRN